MPDPLPNPTPANPPPLLTPAQAANPVYPDHPNPINPVTGKEEILANPRDEVPDQFRPVANPDHDPITGHPFPKANIEPDQQEDEGHIPTEEVPDVLPPKPSMYPLSSAPMPEDAPLAAKSTASVQ
jgi:hypothetical protein